MKINYNLSAEFVKAEFVRTGIKHSGTQTLDVEAATLTPDQRHLLIEIGSNMDAVTLSLPRYDWRGMEYINWQAAQMYSDVASLLADWEAAFNEAFNEAFVAKYDAAVSEIAELRDYQPGLEVQYGRGKPEVKSRYSWHHEYAAALEIAQARWQEASDAYLAKEAAKRAEAEAAKAALEADKRAWCAGPLASDHLRRAVAAGYDCQRLYVTERAAVEYPGYGVDFSDAFSWRARSCPSVEALAEAERVGGLVVWLTEGPEVYGEIEAVVIRGYLSKYDLVKF